MSYLVTLKGGPCDGQTVVWASQPTKSPVPIDCGGVRYQWVSGHTAAATTQAPAGGFPPAGADLDTRQVGAAWHKLTRVLAVEAPAAIRRSRAGRARLKRAVR